jgi:RES domain-containing protein
VGFAQYDAAIAELEQALAARRSSLDTSTVRVVEQNLAVIDRAIAEARRALAADPTDPYLHDHLASTMRRKMDLLRHVTAAAYST